MLNQHLCDTFSAKVLELNDTTFTLTDDDDGVHSSEDNEVLMLIYYSCWINSSANYISKYFSNFFSEKRIWHVMQISPLHEMLNSIFWGKIRKKIPICSDADGVNLREDNEVLMHSMPGKNCSCQMKFWNGFLIFPRKYDLTFHANWRQFACNIKSYFLGK